MSLLNILLYISSRWRSKAFILFKFLDPSPDSTMSLISWFIEDACATKSTTFLLSLLVLNTWTTEFFICGAIPLTLISALVNAICLTNSLSKPSVICTSSPPRWPSKKLFPVNVADSSIISTPTPPNKALVFPANPDANLATGMLTYFLKVRYPIPRTPCWILLNWRKVPNFSAWVATIACIPAIGTISRFDRLK